MAYVTGMPDACRRTNCDGTKFALRKRMKAGGTLLYAYQYQCLSCGSESGTVKASEVERMKLPTTPWDETIYRRWWDGQQATYDQKRQDDRADWFKGYDTYLTSPEWKARRAKVLARAKGVCEGCGERPPGQVHHLTYAHVKDEFLWELAAVCKVCHERLHQKGQPD